MYDSADALVSDPAVDAVYISVPPFAHGQLELKALAAGKALFIEKPIATDLPTAESIAEKARVANAIVSVGYHWRYQSTTDELLRRTRGRPILGATAWWCGGRPGVWWWRDHSTSGGQPVEQTTHLFDLANYIIGAKPISVYATGRKLDVFRDDPKHTVDDVSIAQVRYDNGVAISVWSSDVMNGRSSITGIEFYGIDCRYEIGHGTLTVCDREHATEIKNEGNPYQRANAAFIHAVATGDRSLILADYETSLTTHRVTMAVERSIASGRVETV